MNWTVPTIAGIQRVTALLTVAVALMLLALVSKSAAIGCLAGGALMIGNLYVLTVAGKALVALAQGGGAARIGVVLAPFKLLILLVVVYLLVTSFHIDLVGLLAGSLTQLVAVFIETGRVSLRAGSGTPSVEGAGHDALSEDVGV